MSSKKVSKVASTRMNTTIDDIRDSGQYRACLFKLSKVMDVVQKGDYNKNGKIRDAVMKEMEKIFRQSGLKTFSETFTRMMVVPFQAKTNDQFTSKLIEFFLDVIGDNRWLQENFGGTSLDTTMNSTMSSVDDQTETLQTRILKLCTKHHVDSRSIVRLRFMQIVEKIIPEVIEIEALGPHLQGRLIRMLNTRRKDKNEKVRGLALKNLCLFYRERLPLQNPIEDALLLHMSYDPDASVRLKVVSNIAIKDSILEIFVERTGDPNDSVRAAALNRLAVEVPVVKITADVREVILRANATQDNSAVVQKALNNLLKHWLQHFENNPCEFLRVISVSRRARLCRLALDNLYSESSEEAFEKMSGPLLNDKRYPDESLCKESTFLWLYMYNRFRSDQYIMKKLTLPVNEMIDYIMEYIEVIEDEGELSLSDLEYRSWMLGDMLQILCFLPVEEGERRAVLEFLPVLFQKKKLIDARNCALGVKLISVCSNIQEETYVVDIVNAALDSDKTISRKSRRHSKAKESQKEALMDAITNKENYEQKRDLLRKELGNCIHLVKKREKEQDIASAKNDLHRAKELQEEIQLLKSNAEEIKAKVAEFNESFSSRDASFAIEEEEEEEEEEEHWEYADSTMLIAVTAVKENIEQMGRISVFSRTFYEMYARKAVTMSKDPVVRAKALELLCLIGIEIESEMPNTTIFCLMALLRDVLIVKETALKCLFDLVLKYSFAKLGAIKEVQSVMNGLNTMQDVPKTGSNAIASTLKSLLLSYIRSQESSLVKLSVAGVLKLLFKREINFGRIACSFLTSWAIPSHVTRLRFKDVGIILPVYASMGETEVNEVAKCLINCVKKVVADIHSKAANTEQCPHPDLQQIVGLIVKCTHPSELSSFQRPYIGHLTIALEALKQLIDEDLSTDERLEFAKILKILELKDCPIDSLKEIHHCATEIQETTRRVANIISGFIKHLDLLITGTDRNEDEDDGSEPMDVDETSR